MKDPMLDSANLVLSGARLQVRRVGDMLCVEAYGGGEVRLWLDYTTARDLAVQLAAAAFADEMP